MRALLNAPLEHSLPAVSEPPPRSRSAVPDGFGPRRHANRHNRLLKRHKNLLKRHANRHNRPLINRRQRSEEPSREPSQRLAEASCEPSQGASSRIEALVEPRRRKLGQRTRLPRGSTAARDRLNPSREPSQGLAEASCEPSQAPAAA